MYNGNVRIVFEATMFGKVFFGGGILFATIGGLAKSGDAMALSVIGDSNKSEEFQNAVVDKVKLNNGVTMPSLGLGTFALKDGDETYGAVLCALKAGFRHIDTAHAYGNERAVGKAIKDSGVPREEIWVTSKLWPNEYQDVASALDRMSKRLGLDYLDLVYVHQPVGDVFKGWLGLEQALKSGKVRALGISNFDKDEDLFHEFLKRVKVKPQIMQIECHPYAQRVHWQELLKEHHIQQENWYPLGGRQSQGILLKDPVIGKIAKAHGKSPAQIILRWHIQKGFTVVPGSSNPKHIKENTEIFDFELSHEEMEEIQGMNREERIFNPPYDEQKRKYLETVLVD